MKKKTIIVIIILIVISLIVFGGYKFIFGFKEDQKITKEKIQEITNDYQIFNESIIQFANLREELYKNLENLYLEEVAKNYNDFNTLISDYEQSIKTIEKNSKNLKENCTTKFSDINVNSKCTNFKANYEAAMNYYITDIKVYNNNVKKYNDWIKDNNYNYQLLNEGNLAVYKDYIDFDGDKEYFGKEDIDE